MAKPSPNSVPALSQHELRRVAVVASVDPRTVVKYLHGSSMASTLIARIEAALSECGYASKLRTNGHTNGAGG